MTKQHTIDEKMELYTCSVNGKTAELEKYLNEKKYSVTEEVSRADHFWTVLHYASHYGHLEVIKFLLEYI